MALLAQDDELQARYSQLTDGKKRGLIYAILGTKDVDRQVKIAVAILNGASLRGAVRK